MADEMSLNIEIDEITSLGAYCNLAAVAHSQQEFILDFIFVLPGQNKGKVRSRVIVSPPHAKRLLSALSENISKYENRFGIIKEELPPADLKAGFVH